MTVTAQTYRAKTDRNLEKNYATYIREIKTNLMERKDVVDSLECMVYIDTKIFTSRALYKEIITLVKECITEDNAQQIFNLWADWIIHQRKLEFLDEFIFETLAYNNASILTHCYILLFEAFDEYFYKFVDLFEEIKELSFISNELKKRMQENIFNTRINR
ncbi:hypothetical protein H312_00447 [Anncaliia algerae PRA339]|uniref:Uncharacterized protein n=1 Tax=Anncaliia algerae PRA339 TaxID=1288291 RepID=A0A059F4Q2_9MICR|nr:hypothetical protein H312_00447 [Anncaliia algerae PRA339]